MADKKIPPPERGGNTEGGNSGGTTSEPVACTQWVQGHCSAACSGCTAGDR